MKKLALNRETVASLSPAQMSEVDGGLNVTLPPTRLQTLCGCPSVIVCPPPTTTHAYSICIRPCY
jgi:hypothetical protein